MKTILLVRHGKSSWEETGLTDDKRPLLPKGVKRTNKVVKYLKSINLQPDLIVSSHAKRAFDTAIIFAEAFNIPEADIVVEELLYHAHPERIFNVIYSLPDDAKTVLLFGHNPGFTDAAEEIADRSIDWLPTSGVVSVSFDCDKWTDIPLAGRTTNFIIKPKEL